MRDAIRVEKLIAGESEVSLLVFNMNPLGHDHDASGSVCNVQAGYKLLRNGQKRTS